MDKKQKKITMDKNKMRKMANSIIRTRKKVEHVESGEIDELLTNCNIEVAEMQAMAEPSTSEISISAPGYNLLNSDRVNWIFSENGLHVSNFAPNESIFCFPVSQLDFSKMRDFLVNRVYEIDDRTSVGLCQYVMHLMAAATDQTLALACRDFLKFHPANLTISDIFLILANFGASNEAVDIPRPDYLVSKDVICNGLPFFNIQLVLEYFRDCAEKEEIKFDDNWKTAMQFIAMFALDTNIRGAPVFGTAIRFLSILVDRCSLQFGNDVVAKCLAGIKHPMNKLEICRFLRTSENFTLTLMNRTISKLNHSSSEIEKPEHVRNVIRQCKNRIKEQPLKVYVVIQLVISALPYIEFSAEDVTSVSREIVAVETQISQLRDASDMVRLRGVCSQLRGLLLMFDGVTKCQK